MKKRLFMCSLVFVLLIAIGAVYYYFIYLDSDATKVGGVLSLESDSSPYIEGNETDHKETLKVSSNDITMIQEEVIREQIKGDQAGQAEEIIGETEQNLVYVHVCGAVKRSGVYGLSPGKRVSDAILLAGGCTKDAAVDYINLAQILNDGVRIYIPRKEELELLTVEQKSEGVMVADPEKGLHQNEDASGNSKRLIDINRASLQELMTLPGIGEAKAEHIIAYREANGGFQVPEDIMNVTGIKEAAFQKLSSYITVE